jgi:predicted kinase
MFKDEFVTLYFNELRLTPHFSDTMACTIEDSPWHREQNVLVHTDMVVAQYLSMNPESWDRYILRGAFASAFHDVGKPKAEQVHETEDRGVYRKYTGHELVSARLWEEWAYENMPMLSNRFDFIPEDIYAVGWMIQSHLPFAIKKTAKREALRRTALTVLKRDEVFINCISADCWGRISDNHPQKKQDLLAWAEEYKQIDVEFPDEDTYSGDEAPVGTVYILVGASGCGKSTFVRNNADGVVHSMDQLRLDWYTPNSGDPIVDYTAAFASSCEDEEFRNKVQTDFIDTLKLEPPVVYVDNTNLSAKRRNFYSIEARKRGYKVVGVIFPINRHTLVDRQETRTDKIVPIESVMQHWWNVQYPSIGEMDSVIVGGELPK